MRCLLVLGAMAVTIGLLGSCRSNRSNRTIQKVISKKDTASIVIVHKDELPDSLIHLHSVMKRMFAHHINYTTFSATVKVEYSNEQGTQPDFKAHIQMRKDSIIWIDISGPLGIGGFRVLITPDSLRILDEQAHTYKVRALSYLQEVAAIPFDFKTLQDMLIGNLIFFDSSRITSYKQGTGSIFLLSTGDIFKNLVTLANSDNRVMHVKLDDVDPTRNRTADLTYDDYAGAGGFQFSTTRSIGFSEKGKVDIELNFKEFKFNVPITTPFNVTKRYKRVK